MKTLRILWLGLVACFVATADAQNPSNTQTSAPIPLDQLGAVAAKQYHGDGLSVSATPDGARVRCVFQQLEGDVTADGLWLSSTVDGTSGERFRVMAVKVGRSNSWAAADYWTGPDPFSWTQPALAAAGSVKVADNVARFIRGELTEEYSVSVDGVRQDFIIEQRPEGEGKLRVELDVTGAKAEPLVNGARLVLDGSGRKLAYNRLHVTDVRGRGLMARLEVTDAMRLAVVVDDVTAEYPLRIDPTFSDANWISLGGIPGASGAVSAAVVDVSGNLYIGGDFGSVGDTIADRIAKWDGISWSAVGAGMNNSVIALAVLGSDVYAGGTFTVATNSGGGAVTVNRIAKWDGTNWSALGTGMNSVVRALAASGSNVFAGGDFFTAGGSAANRIAKWDGNNWSALGLGLSSTANALAVSGSGDVYAGGDFATAGGGAANRVAKWDGTNWTALGSGTSGTVYALASATDLYAGGSFGRATNSGGVTVTVNNIAKWDGTNWTALGSGTSGTVFALAMSGNDMCAAGNFTTAGGAATNNIAKWNGSSWTALGVGMNNIVRALAASGSDLYAGGDFTTAGGGAANFITKWNGSSWSALGSGMNNVVYALVVSGTNLYAGGTFTVAGESRAKYIAKWNGSSWSALGSGLEGGQIFAPINTPAVYALAAAGSDVYAAGIFTVPGVFGVERIAKWDGNTWTVVASEMNNNVLALAVSGSNLYAGGIFTTAGGGACSHIAKWNGSSWTNLGSGMNNVVYTLAVSGTNLYAGGTFTVAGSSSANYIAKWNGSSWSALGSGVNSYVVALAVSGNDVYAGGYFGLAGSAPANRIAKWNGSSWSALGLGMNDYVYALAVSGNDVYAGGVFTTAGGNPANRIAKWNGNSWSVLGLGMNKSVGALAVSGSDLFAGGYFTTAGGKVSAYAARAIINPGNWLTIQCGVPGPNTNTLTYAGIPNDEYLLQFATNLTFSPWFTLATNTPTANGLGTVIDPTATNMQRFYRVSTP